MNYKNVKVDGTTVQLLDPKAAIDLGAIAKGYIADQLKEYLESAGIKHGPVSYTHLDVYKRQVLIEYIQIMIQKDRPVKSVLF